MKNFRPHEITVHYFYEEGHTSIGEALLVKPNVVAEIVDDEVVFRKFPRSLSGEKKVDFYENDESISHFSIILTIDMNSVNLKKLTAMSLTDLAEIGFNA
ncbi:hypothetical protein [Rossellomorea sp. RS05]|uniref:hypothetical protein n=1 Tax=Rossellomorea sp. RS05 TaxID=3149166 RepID=UPI0032220D35